MYTTNNKRTLGLGSYHRVLGKVTNVSEILSYLVIRHRRHIIKHMPFQTKQVSSV